MDPYITLSLVDYIQLLYGGPVAKSLFTYFEAELQNCSPAEVNTAIENLMIRYKDVDEIETTVARFIRSVTPGLEKNLKPEYATDSIFFILDKENQVIDTILKNLKKVYVRVLPVLRTNNIDAKMELQNVLGRIEAVKKHYLKLQYGVFSALESEGAPTRCIQLMWHLQDSIWPRLKDCREMLSGKVMDFNQFNKTYVQMFFLLSSLVFREDRILFPLAYQYLPAGVQRKLMLDAESYGIINEQD